MPYDGRDIANFILDICDENDRKITNLALQKIIYFCHVWSLIDFDRPLIKQRFEAWQYGPVLPYVYREFKEFDASPITKRAQKLNIETGEKVVASIRFDETTEDWLKRVINFYSRLSAGQLVELTHTENGPWAKVWKHEGAVNPGMKINDREIKIYYSQVIPPYGIQ